MKNTPEIIFISKLKEADQELSKIIEWSILENNRFGLFASLHRKIANRLLEVIQLETFSQPDLVEELGIVFTNKYLRSFVNYLNSLPLSKTWQLAFDYNHKNYPIVLEHLMLGMNAHMNLDLGLSAAEVAPGTRLLELKDDFRRVTNILSKVVHEIQNDIMSKWKSLNWLETISGERIDYFADLSMGLSRDNAWNTAVKFAQLTEEEWIEEEELLDEKITEFGEVLKSQGFGMRSFMIFIRLLEKGSVAEKVKVLH